MITIELWEEWGYSNGGRGINSSKVSNINWKDIGDGTTQFNLAPLKRPSKNADIKFSYKKYNYFKITGNYTRLVRPQLSINPGRGVGGQIAWGTSTLYKLSWTYNEPDNQFDGNMKHALSDTRGSVNILLPLSTSPNYYVPYKEEHLSPNVVLYTPYIVTQLMVQKSSYDDPKDRLNDIGNSYGALFDFTVVAYQ